MTAPVLATLAYLVCIVVIGLCLGLHPRQKNFRWRSQLGNDGRYDGSYVCRCGERVGAVMSMFGRPYVQMASRNTSRSSERLSTRKLC